MGLHVPEERHQAFTMKFDEKTVAGHVKDACIGDQSAEMMLMLMAVERETVGEVIRFRSGPVYKVITAYYGGLVKALRAAGASDEEVEQNEAWAMMDSALMVGAALGAMISGAVKIDLSSAEKLDQSTLFGQSDIPDVFKKAFDDTEGE